MARNFFRFARSPPRPGRAEQEESTSESIDVRTNILESLSSPDLTAINPTTMSPKKEGLSRSSSTSKRLASWRRSLRLQQPVSDPSSSGQTVAPVAQSSRPAIIDILTAPPQSSAAKQTDPLQRGQSTSSTSRHAKSSSAPTITTTSADDTLDESFDFIDHPDVTDPYERPPSRCSSRRSSVHISPPSQSVSLPSSSSPHSSPRSSLLGLPVMSNAALLTELEMDMHIAAASSSEAIKKIESEVQERSVFEDDDDDQANEDELAQLRAYARNVRDFMGMFRMHADELFDEEYHEQHIRQLGAQQQRHKQKQDQPRKCVDEFEDASDNGGEEDMEIDEEEAGNSIISAAPGRGQLRRVGGSHPSHRETLDESDSYDSGFDFEYGQVGEESEFEDSFAMQSNHGVQQRPRGGSVPLHWRFSELEVIDEEEDEDEPEAPVEATSPMTTELKDQAREDSSLIESQQSMPANLACDVAELDASSVPLPSPIVMPSPLSTPPPSASSNTSRKPVLTLAMPSSSPSLSSKFGGISAHDRDSSASSTPNSGSALLTPASTLWHIMTQPRRRRSFAPFPPSKQSVTPDSPNAQRASLSPFGPPTKAQESHQPAPAFVIDDNCGDDPISPDRAGSLQDILGQMKTEKSRLENLERYYTSMASPEKISKEQTTSVRTQIDALSRAIRQLELASPTSPAPGAPVIGSVPLPASSPISPASPAKATVHKPATPQKSPNTAAKPSPSKSAAKLTPSSNATGLQRSPSKGRTSTLSNLDLPPLSPLITLAHNSPVRSYLPKIVTEGDDFEDLKRGLLFCSPVKAQPPAPSALTPLVSPVRSESPVDPRVDDSIEDPFVAAVEHSPISPRLTEAFQVSVSSSCPSSPTSHLETSGILDDLYDEDETIMPGRLSFPRRNMSEHDLPGRAQIKRRAGSLDLKKSIMVCGA